MCEFILHEESVQPEWIDYNGHMNVAYYVLVFDHATDGALEALGMGEAYREAENNTFFVAESHVVYEREVKKDDLLVVKTKLIGYDTKRLHISHEMYVKDGKDRCAGNEVMALHVDMERRKTAEIPLEHRNAIKTGVEKSLQNGVPDYCARAIQKLHNKF
ncbi:Thioesterase-like protein [Candidatus Terasakiella magnetica]|uniref:Thioesterase-like protein n=1 Tax=Candidatus Terasakiella magnetica TaxID=1867952 RepID=A0A1C3RKK5_9PROT|nr:thioesterase family protein [Candidatus Terasakiella magnetica]SCA57778.1 Thioesterase-like protein [Candidatus Terasakiella magnetica]